MNIALRSVKRETAITLFTLTWLAGSIVVSSYFAFSLFPNVYSEKQSAIVEVLFQTKDQTGKTRYWLNAQGNRGKYSDVLSDDRVFYFDACEAAPLSQRAKCNSSDNWWPLTPASLGCTEFDSCEATEYRLDEAEREFYITNLEPNEGESIKVSDKKALSFSDPLGWGHSARWPLFFIALFLALRLGRALGEFTFLAYEN